MINYHKAKIHKISIKKLAVAFGLSPFTALSDEEG
jgi:hypothetical protein